jgi:glycosyltransferase involved in cell wall biosynthesis
MRPRLIYYGESYISLAHAASEYLRILARMVPVVSSPDEAEIAIIHAHPSAMAPLLDLPLPKVGYLVWENDRIPDAWLPVLDRLHTVWTPTAFSAAAFSRHHARVRVLPHVVRPLPEPTSQDTAYIRGCIDKQPGDFIVFGIATADERRKNLAQLARAFAMARGDMAGARLVLKTFTGGAEGLDEYATVLRGRLNAGQMHALYKTADLFVSPHTGEGWGLSITDAMQSGVLTAATAHSGNLDYMSEQNSLLIPCTIEPGSDGSSSIPRLADRSWAQINDEVLAETLVRGYNLHKTGEAECMREAARNSMAAFTPERIERRLDELLQEILAS